MPRRTLLMVMLCTFPVFALPLRVGDLSVETETWQVSQQAKSRSTLILGLKRVGTELVFFRNPENAELGLSWDSRGRSWQEEHHGLRWDFSLSSQAHAFHLAFRTEHRGVPYVGYASGLDLTTLYENVKAFLSGVRVFEARSLTQGFFYGKKYYLGFGDYLSGFMGNEVKYDISHTHDIFTKEIGGNYIGTKINGSGQGASQVRDYWRDLGADMLWNDMYVQYSAGHGYETGLAFGVSYNEIRDTLLALPAKEVIVFIMACHSGGLVNAFDDKKYLWENWGEYDRTLFVMASSRVSELSSTGPGTDPQEPNGPNGSAGSAFGHALWKALIGHADGYNNNIKDGMISLGEIIDYTIWKTKSSWGHTPVYTGVFDRNLIINRVPSASELRTLRRGMALRKPADMAEQIRELNTLVNTD